MYSINDIENTDPDSTRFIVIGITVTILTSVIGSLGLTLQQKSFINQNSQLAEPLTPFRKFYRKHLWAIGFGIYLLGSATSSVSSIGSLPVTLLAPVGAFSLISNALFAKFILDDVLSYLSLIGTAIIVIGAGIVGYYGVIPDKIHNLDELLLLYQRPGFIIYFSIQELLLATLLIWNYFYNEKRLIKSESSLLPEKLPFSKYSVEINRTIIGLIYGACASAIQTQSILFCKSGIQLLTLTFGGNNQFNHILTWVIVLGLIVSVVVQLFFLNKGIEYCDIVVGIPSNYCVATLFCLFNGLAYFNQWSDLSWFNFIMVIIGTGILSTGVVLLSIRPKKPSPPSMCDNPTNKLGSQSSRSSLNLPINAHQSSPLASYGSISANI
jgi:hypothetical protein